MTTPHLLVEARDGVAVLTVNRPETLNALDAALLAQLEEALGTIEADARVRSVVLTGAGAKAFVAGADIAAMARMGAAEAHAFSRAGQRVVSALQRLRKPVVAAVNGYAFGGGLELALACDFAYAAETATFGARELALGIIPGFGGTQHLARIVGPSRARELVLTAKVFSAREAKEWGIVNEVFPAAEVVAAAIATARQIAAHSSAAVAAAKDAITSGLDMARDDGLRFEAALFGALFGGADPKEGLAAFLQKRKPTFNNP